MANKLYKLEVYKRNGELKEYKANTNETKWCASLDFVKGIAIGIAIAEGRQSTRANIYEVSEIGDKKLVW